MNDKLFRTWLTGCGWRIVSEIVMGVAALVFFGGCMLAAALIPMDDDYRPLVFIGGVAGFFVISMAGVVIWFLWSKGRRAQRFDAAFTPYGLTGRGYMTVGRQYHGVYQGRELHVYFYRGPVLDIYLGTPLKTRLALGTRTMLGSAASGLVQQNQLTLSDPAYHHLLASAVDARWAQELLALPEAKDVILRLAAAPGYLEMDNLFLQPGAFLLRLYRIPESRITPENLQQWLRDLYTLARAAESLPPPQVTAEPTANEGVLRTDRDAFNRKVYAITLGAFALLTLCTLAITALIVWLAMQGN
jgi:hypothetical protein